MIKVFPKLSLKNQILFFSLTVILLVSFFIALVARYILISSLTRELEYRGLGIADSIADSSTGLILTQDLPGLVSLVFEAAQVGERQSLVSYVFILDTEQNVLASTFIRPFPEDLRTANPILPREDSSITTVDVFGEQAYDCAVPVKEGIYDVGSVHVGLSKNHIDMVISKLRMAFLGFLGGIFVIMFFISNKLSRNITKPISQLIDMSDEIRRDNLDYRVDFDESAGVEVVQLAESLDNMVRHVKDYRGQLQKSQQKYRSLFHSGPDPIFVLEYDSLTILDANPMATEVYGCSRMELIGRPFTEFWDPSDDSWTLHFAEVDEVSLAKCIFIPKALHYTRDNYPFNVNVHACGTTYEDKPAIIMSTTDITDMVEKDAQLIQASKMKTLGEMSAGIAHEINQPLNAIKLGSEYLAMIGERGETPSGDKFQQVVTEICRQVDRAAEIITSLREFGRKSDLLKDRFDISEPLTDVLNLIREQLKLENITITTDFTQGLPPIMAHQNRMQQVYFNLLSNSRDALNAMDEAGSNGKKREIRIGSFMDQGLVCLSIADSGIGIPQAKLDKIFEPFYTT
ncbi:MAG: PAS domain S-box protein, partial [Desulfovibrio sp.]